MQFCHQPICVIQANKATTEAAAVAGDAVIALNIVLSGRLKKILES